MKIIQKGILLTAVLLASGSCTNDFEEMNIDPNRIEEVSPATLLNPILYGVASHNTTRAYDVTFQLMQVKTPFPATPGGLHRYDVANGTGNSSWNTYYRWLKNIKEMKAASEKAEDDNYLAIALTLNAYLYSNLTDLFGPVPMTEAVMGEEGILYPSFDSQEYIYEQILSDLERANTLYDENLEMVYTPDLLFNNDVERWQKFTNSLHMRLLLRISNKVPSSLDKLAQMIGNPEVYPVFETTEESAILQVTGVEPNVSPWGRPQDFYNGNKVSSFFLDNLNAWEDPRRPIFATQATVMVDDQPSPIGYVGIPSAFEGSESQFEYEASIFQRRQVENPMQLVLLPYSEVAFIKAELAQRGYIDEAETHYVNGVRGAMEQVGAELPEDYFDNPLTQYDGSLEQILLQKYYALYFVDYQQWFEYRRTGLPELPTTNAMHNDAKMPSRLRYPSDLAVENPEGFLQGVQLLGGSDDINVKVWWDTVD